MSRLQKLGVVLATTTAFTMNFAGAAFSQNMDELVAAAKAEGMLTTIALPHSWCGYGEVIAGFKAKYPEITVNELNPDAGSADEVEAIKANKDNKGPQAPDVVDGALEVGTVMAVTLSADHRAWDGALAARWLAAFVARIENPLTILA